MNQNNQDKKSIDVSEMLKEKDSGGKPRGWQQPRVYVSPFAPKIVQWIVRYSGGLIKNERQAYYVLIGFIIFVVIISFFIVFGRSDVTKRQELFTPPAEAPIEQVIPPAQF